MFCILGLICADADLYVHMLTYICMCGLIFRILGLRNYIFGLIFQVLNLYFGALDLELEAWTCSRGLGLVVGGLDL